MLNNIFNKNFKNSKKIIYSLIEIYGINIYQSKKICKYIGINPTINIKKIKNYHLNKLKIFIKKNMIIDHFLKKKKKNYLNYLLEIKNLKGIRNYFGLPNRGQRTHSNSKTIKRLNKKNNNNKNYDKKKKNK